MAAQKRLSFHRHHGQNRSVWVSSPLKIHRELDRETRQTCRSLRAISPAMYTSWNNRPVDVFDLLHRSMSITRHDTDFGGHDECFVCVCTRYSSCFCRISSSHYQFQTLLAETRNCHAIHRFGAGRRISAWHISFSSAGRVPLDGSDGSWDTLMSPLVFIFISCACGHAH